MDCPSIPDVDYGDFSRRLHEDIARQRIPAAGSIDLTSRCNLNCVHCYVRSSPKDELSLAELDRVLDQMAAAGCLWLLLTGGEPLLRPDFPDIYLLAKKKGFIVNLFTNATLVTEETGRLLAEWRPFAIEVTLYGATREVYEEVTRAPGSFDKCMRGIEILSASGLPLRIKTMLLSINRHELGRMRAFAEDLGYEFRYDANIHGHLDGSGEPRDYRLSPEEVIEVDLEDTGRVDAIKEFVSYASRFSKNEGQLFHCGAGLNSFHVDSRGRLCPCMLARRQSFDLRQLSFADGWEAMKQVRFQKPKGPNSCAACHLYDLCGQCPGWGEIENGDAEAPSEFLCRLAHLREQALGEAIFTKGNQTK